MKAASVVTIGKKQSIELPEGFRIDSSEVYVKRVGRSILLIPKEVDLWDLLAESLDQFSEDFMQERGQPAEQQREVAFE